MPYFSFVRLVELLLIFSLSRQCFQIIYTRYKQVQQGRSHKIIGQFKKTQICREEYRKTKINIKQQAMIQTIFAKKIIFFILLILLGLTINAETNLPEMLKATAENLPYQAHSFNDLDYARNLMLKKTKYFKFDASLANKASCQKYSTWKNTIPCFSSDQYAQQMCCIAMRGDAGSEPNFNFPFNTSDEFVALLSSHLQQYSAKIAILFVAIDIQFGFQFKNAIAENFLFKLAELMNKYKNLHITTGGNFILEYDRICRLSQTKNDGQIINFENAVGKEACTAQRKSISDSRFFLQSGSMDPYDDRNYKGRFKNFNIIYKEIDRLCRDGFPTWPNKYPDFPLIFWEPSNQDQILSSLAKLLSPSCQKKHNRTVKGIAFASNIDPEIFSIFMKSFSKIQSPWYFESNKLLLENAVSVKLAKIIGVNDQTKTNSKERFAVYWQVKSGDFVKNYLNIFSHDDQNQKIDLIKTIELDAEVAELRGVQDKIIVITKRQQTNSRQFDTTFVTYNSKLELIKTKEIDSFISSFATEDYIYFITRTSNPTFFNIYFADPIDLIPQSYGVSSYMPREQIDSITSIYFKKGLKRDDDIFLVFSNNNDQTWMTQMKNGNILKNKVLTYGTDARVVNKEDGQVLILLENSYMNSGLLLNNNAENKCRLHKYESLSPLAHVPNLVNVLEGSIEKFMDFFNIEDEEIITACHPHIYFSRHLNGKHSQIISVWGNTFISSQYVPIQKQDLIVTLFSGGSNYDKELRNSIAFFITSTNGNNSLRNSNQAIMSDQ